MAKVEDFFINLNAVENALDYSSGILTMLIRSVEAFARVTYQSVYLIDYYKQDFLYVAENPLFLCGHTAEEVKEMGYSFYLQHVPEDEQKMLVEVNHSGFKLFNSLADDEKYKASISYDFHLQYEKKQTLVNHKLTPVLLTNEGRIWIAMCVVSLSSQKAAGQIQFNLTERANYWEYSMKGHKWNEKKGIELKAEEIEVLQLSVTGFTMGEIAERMCKSVDTIKFYKRSAFKKLGVDNITEAIAKSMTHRLF